MRAVLMVAFLMGSPLAFAASKGEPIDFRRVGAAFVETFNAAVPKGIDRSATLHLGVLDILQISADGGIEFQAEIRYARNEGFTIHLLRRTGVIHQNALERLFVENLWPVIAASLPGWKVDARLELTPNQTNLYKVDLMLRGPRGENLVIPIPYDYRGTLRIDPRSDLTLGPDDLKKRDQDRQGWQLRPNDVPVELREPLGRALKAMNDRHAGWAELAAITQYGARGRGLTREIIAHLVRALEVEASTVRANTSDGSRLVRVRWMDLPGVGPTKTRRQLAEGVPFVHTQLGRALGGEWRDHPGAAHTYFEEHFDAGRVEVREDGVITHIRVPRLGTRPVR